MWGRRWPGWPDDRGSCWSCKLAGSAPYHILRRCPLNIQTYTTLICPHHQWFLIFLKPDRLSLDALTQDCFSIQVLFPRLSRLTLQNCGVLFSQKDYKDQRLQHSTVMCTFPTLGKLFTLTFFYQLLIIGTGKSWEVNRQLQGGPKKVSQIIFAITLSAASQFP